MLKRTLACTTVVAHLISTPAFAGAHDSREVDVDPAYRFARGDLVTARKAIHPLVYIECWVRAIGNIKEGHCSARDAAGDTITTNNTSNAGVVALIESIDANAYIQFSWDANNDLIELQVTKSSRYVTPDFLRNP